MEGTDDLAFWQWCFDRAMALRLRLPPGELKGRVERDRLPMLEAALMATAVVEAYFGRMGDEEDRAAARKLYDEWRAERGGDG